MTAPTAEQQLRARQRAERRALVKQHHPDRGGDVDRFVEVLAALESRPTAVRAEPRGARRRHHLMRAVQASLPRRLPGAKRYATY